MDQKMAGSALSQLLAPRKGQEHAVEIKGKNNQISSILLHSMTAAQSTARPSQSCGSCVPSPPPHRAQSCFFPKHQNQVEYPWVCAHPTCGISLLLK